MSVPVLTLVTTRDRIRAVAARWAEQYAGYGPWTEFGEVTRRLAALDPERATAAEVDAIIGNNTWTEVVCESCDKAVPSAVSFASASAFSDPDPVALLCRSCLRAGLDALTDDYDGERP